MFIYSSINKFFNIYIFLSSQKNYMECDPGTDVTALIWKSLQSKQIQVHLDQSHNLYDNQNSNNTPLITTPVAVGDRNDLDESVKPIIKKQLQLKQTDNKNVYAPKIIKLYDYIKNPNNQATIRPFIQKVLIHTPLTPNDQDYRNEFTRITTDFCNINNYIDVRKSKKWILYLLSDNIPRIGTCQPHFIYNKIPGWLIDAMQITSEKNLFLIYSTDMRGVNEWLGQLCSLINLHHLLAINLESNNDVNCTAILIHLAGLLTNRKLNPINRQGMSFPNSILQKTTFENVKKQLSTASGSDNLTNFISTTLTVIPHKTGTNSFNLLSSE